MRLQKKTERIARDKKYCKNLIIDRTTPQYIFDLLFKLTFFDPYISTVLSAIVGTPLSGTPLSGTNLKWILSITVNVFSTVLWLLKEQSIGKAYLLLKRLTSYTANEVHTFH